MRFLTFLVILISIPIKAQIQLKGKVSDEFGFALSDCLVYIDGSSIFTYTNSDGEFNLNLTSGNFTIVFKKEEFTTHSILVNSNQNNLDIKLQKNYVELSEAVIEPISKKDWDYYYKVFTSNFLGNNKAAQDCKILNPKALKFRYDNKNKILTARATESLIIQNNFLGYEIEYNLEDFQIDFLNQQNFMAGSSFFKEMKGSNKKQNNWNENREISYNGSIMHFFRSFYNQNLKEEGFIINRLIRSENPEYVAYREKIEINKELGLTLKLGKIPPKLIETLVRQEIPYEDLIYKRENRTFIHFNQFIHVEYVHEKEDEKYVQIHKKGKFVGNQSSVISLLGDKVIEIDATGNFYPPSNLLIEEYFTWEKIGNLLPLDFQLN